MRPSARTFGAELRRERELRQISLREVAEATKINLRFLEALESNDFEHLPGGVFNRGFVRAYAVHIGVDPDAMVNAYLLEEREGDGESVTSDDRMLDTYRSIVQTRATTRKRDRSHGFRWLAAGIGGVLLVAAGTLLYFRFAPTAGEAQTGQAAPPTAAPEITRPIHGPETSPSAEPAPRGELRTGGGDDDGTTGNPLEPPATAPGGATVFIDRPVAGRLNCDSRQIEVLDGMRPGTRLDLACESYLIVDASDAGALRIALSGRATVPLGPDGQALSSHRIDIPASKGENRP